MPGFGFSSVEISRSATRADIHTSTVVVKRGTQCQVFRFVCTWLPEQNFFRYQFLKEQKNNTDSTARKVRGQAGKPDVLMLAVASKLSAFPDGIII
jgi:hypothetical protein